MTLSTYTTVAVPSLPGGWEATCLQIHNSILAVGLVQTADTGQINFGTANPGNNATHSAGYAIYRFNDSFQASYPCFIRVDFGTDQSGLTYYGVGIWLTMATSTDGAGTLGAIKSPTIYVNIQWYNETNAVGASSGTPSRLTLVSRYNQTGANGVSAVSFERIQDTTGVDTSTGLVMTWVKYCAMQNSFPYQGQQVLYFSGIQPPAFYNNNGSPVGGMLPAILPYNASVPISAWANGNFCFTSPIYPVGYTLHPPIQGLMIGFAADFIPSNWPLPVSIYGTSHSWAVFAQSWLSQVNGAANLLVRWD